MGVQFGRWNWDGKPLNPSYLAKVKGCIAPYGPDDAGSYEISDLCILYRALHTTTESRSERQPQATASGARITWDGRLDNRTELIAELRDALTDEAPDVAIVAAGYEHWGTACFARLIGDWALSIWDAKSRSLILAKDPIGTRHLYYSIEVGQVTWSSVLDPLVLFADKSLSLCQAYIAGWLSQFPAPYLTPYAGIHSVPPSSFVDIRSDRHTIKKYWDFDPHLSIRYRSDTDYEEHFRSAFAVAVKRRLRSDRPILAELSGGMDSSSIVCMADTLLAEGGGQAPRLDTVSYYDDSEPNWDERPFFTVVEQKRGQAGCHIRVGGQNKLRLQANSNQFAPTPASENFCSEGVRQLANSISARGNRVLLSGIGGDEVTGGVPTPVPELADLVARLQMSTFARQLMVWALERRQPWVKLLWESICIFLPVGQSAKISQTGAHQLVSSEFARRQSKPLNGFLSRTKLLGPLPSFQENLCTLDGLRRQFSCTGPSPFLAIERRYPYLDRDFLQFLYAIPREQLVRPGQRRSLMRRALADIVPGEILSRRRKAFVIRQPTVALSARWDELQHKDSALRCDRLGFADRSALQRNLEMAREGKEVPVNVLMRLLLLESWLRHAEAWHVITSDGDSFRAPNSQDKSAEHFFSLKEEI